jgi:hypothetical protein
MKSKKNSFYHRNKIRIWIFSVVAVLVVIRLILPFVLLHFVNKELANLKGYYGHVHDIDLSIYRGAYQVQDAYLNKSDTNTHEQTPFIALKEADLSVEWRALFKGKIVGEIYLMQPELIFTMDKVEPKQVQKDSTTFKDLLDEFMPLQINRFEVMQGKLRFKDPFSRPPVDISMKEVYVVAENLKSVVDTNKLLPGTVYAEADVYEGKLTMNMKVDPLADEPAFDLNAKLENTNLPLMNDFFKAYGKFDVNKGRFGLYSEFASKDNKFDGYVKPVITDLDVLGKEDSHDSFLHKLWEGLVGSAGEIFENQKKDQFATKLEIKGNFKDPALGTWGAVVEVLKNAFVQALQPAIDNQINIASVDKEKKEKKKTFLQKIFSKNKKQEAENRN